MAQTTKTTTNSMVSMEKINEPNDKKNQQWKRPLAAQPTQTNKHKQITPKNTSKRVWTERTFDKLTEATKLDILVTTQQHHMTQQYQWYAISNNTILMHGQKAMRR